MIPSENKENKIQWDSFQFFKGSSMKADDISKATSKQTTGPTNENKKSRKKTPLNEEGKDVQAPKRKRASKSEVISVNPSISIPESLNPTISTKSLNDDDILSKYRVDLGRVLSQKEELSVQERKLRLMIKKLNRKVAIAEYNEGIIVMH